MARLINNNKDIEGIITKTKSSKGIKTVRHKISQFADDSTFILRRGDVSAALATLALWCAATGMRENEKKREVMLLGSMRERDAAGNLTRPPPGIDPRTIINDREHLRALGVPMGNEFSIVGWWRKKYSEIKTRISKWHGLGSLSLAGRNILVQAIVYGCMRYWFFTLPVPEEIISDVEADVKQLLWSAMPELQANERGTAKNRNDT